MKIITGILATTHVDKNNDKFTKEALDDLAQQINNKNFPLLINHDWDKKIGDIVYAEVLQLDDAEHALKTISIAHDKDIDKYGVNIKGSAAAKISNTTQHNELSQLFNRINSYSILPSGDLYEVKELVATWNHFKLFIYKENNHRKPHVHVYKAEFSASFEIDTGTCLAGNFKDKDQKKIFKHWLKNYKVELLNIWHQLQAGEVISTDLG